MKRCLACSTDFVSEGWVCPSCGHAPDVIDGFPAFAPALAHSNEGFAPDAHHVLDRLQEDLFWFRSRNRLLQDLARRHFANARSVFEVGCGTGYVLSGLRKALPSARLAGSEIYANGLGYAATRLGGRADLFQMDALDIPFTAEFDLIAACDVLEHIDDDEGVLREIHRALVPGGGVLLTVPQHPALWSEMDEIACHKRRYRRRELADKVRRAGFEVICDTSFVFTLLPAMAASRLLGSKKRKKGAAQLVPPRLLDGAFELALDLERRLIAWGLVLPVGGSRVVVARKSCVCRGPKP